MTVRLISSLIAAAAVVGVSGAQAVPNVNTVSLYLKSSGYEGAVDVTPSGTQIGECTTYCRFTFPVGSAVRLRAQRGTGVFSGWTGFASNLPSPCSGRAYTCPITMNQSVDVKALFSPVALRVQATEGGYLDVPNAGPLRCGEGCYLFPRGSIAELRARAVGENEFAGWTGGCARIGPNCDVRMDDNRSLGANFECTAADACQVTQPLSTKVQFWVKVIGPGSVTGSINCGRGSCSKSVGVGQQLSLQATPPEQPRTWYGRHFRCAASAGRCTFRVAMPSSSISPALVVRFG